VTHGACGDGTLPIVYFGTKNEEEIFAEAGDGE